MRFLLGALLVLGIWAMVDGVEARPATERIFTRPGMETVVREIVSGQQTVMREVVKANGNFAWETLDSETQTWKPVLWIQNTVEPSMGTRTGVLHVGDQFIMHCRQINQDLCYFWEARRSGTPNKPESWDVQGVGWMFADTPNSRFVWGGENFYKPSLATTDPTLLKGLAYPNTSELVAEFGYGQTNIIGKVSITAPDGKPYLLFKSPSGNWRGTFATQAINGQPRMQGQAWNGLTWQFVP